jgi:hypothetical protein
MADWKDWLFFPLKAAGAFAKIAGRVTIGITGFALMGLGLLLISPLHVPLWIALPIIAVGLLLLARSVF